MLGIRTVLCICFLLTYVLSCSIPIYLALRTGTTLACRAAHVTKKYIAMVMDFVVGLLSAFKVVDIVHGIFSLLVFANRGRYSVGRATSRGLQERRDLNAPACPQSREAFILVSRCLRRICDTSTHLGQRVGVSPLH